MGIPNIGKYLEVLYAGTATVYDYVSTDNGHGAKTAGVSQTATYTDIPCRLSYRDIEPGVGDHYSDIHQDIVMFCDPQYTINPGAKIIITQEGATQDYECAGLRAVYKSHQEIRLVAYRKRA